MISFSEIKALSVHDLYDFLWDSLECDTMCRETIEEFRMNRINGESILELTEEELKNLCQYLEKGRSSKD